MTIQLQERRMFSARNGFIALFILLGVIVGGVALRVNWLRGHINQRLYTYTVKSRLAVFEDAASKRLRPHLKEAKFDRLPDQLRLMAFKKERKLEVYGRQYIDDKWVHIRTYPLLAASGVLGPKLREGDMQVPEGEYVIEGLNPNSAYHVSMRVNYPNKADQRQAKIDGRLEPGSDIYIHGKALSSGCLAVGDIAAEELFMLTAHARSMGNRIDLWISPVDTRLEPYPKALLARVPAWTKVRYDALAKRIASVPSPASRTKK